MLFNSSVTRKRHILSLKKLRSFLVLQDCIERVQVDCTEAGEPSGEPELPELLRPLPPVSGRWS
uniref:Uncharacterized protein n=1 Tax=Arundo donax TaxID=35708 RepID=A0A0A9G3Y0_ARUDO